MFENQNKNKNFKFDCVSKYSFAGLVVLSIAVLSLGCQPSQVQSKNFSDHQTTKSTPFPVPEGQIFSQATQCPYNQTLYDGICYENPIVLRKVGGQLSKCWEDGKWICPLKDELAGVGIPDKHSISPLESFQFTAFYYNVSQILLRKEHIIFEGQAQTGCQAEVSEVNATDRLVTVSGCRGSGRVRIKIAEGSALNQSAQPIPALQSSTEVMIYDAQVIPSNLSYTKTMQTYKGIRGQSVDYELYFPTDYAIQKDLPAVILIHGGGWQAGSYNDESVSARALASAGFVVANVNYSLLNSSILAAPFTDGVEDIQKFMKTVQTSAAQFNVSLKKISLLGSSAGGHLALMQAVRADNPLYFQCVMSGAGPTNLQSIESAINYSFTAQLVRTVFGRPSDVYEKFSPQMQVENMAARKVALFHQVEDNLVPIQQSLELSRALSKQRPDIDVSLVFGGATNPYPIYNPSPSEANHVYGYSKENELQAVVSYFHHNCR